MIEDVAPLRIDVRITKKHIEDALWFTIRRHTPGLRVLPVTLVLALAAPFALLVVTSGGQPLPLSAYVFASGCFVYALAVPFGLRSLAARSAERRSGGQSFVFDSKGFSASGNGISKTLEWHALYQAVTTRDLFLLYERPSVFHIVPAAGENAEAIRALLRTHVPTKRRAIDFLSWLSPGTIVLLVLTAIGLSVYLGSP